MVLRGITEQGVTRIRTRRQNFRILVKAVFIAVGVAVCVYLGGAAASLVTGNGWHLPQLHLRPPLTGNGSLLNLSGKKSNTKHFQFPATLTTPASWRATLTGAAPLLAGWILLLRSPLLRRRRHTGPDRHRGFAAVKDIRELYSARAVRAFGAFTTPGAGWWRRLTLPMSSFGYQVGSPLQPRVKGMRLWFNFETRLRIVARSGGESRGGC